MERTAAMFGWQGLIGWVHSLAAVTHTPLELYQLLPEGVGVMFSTLGKLDQSAEQTEAALERLEGAARFLGTNGADVVIANSSPMVTHGGPGADRRIIERLAQAAGRPATTTTTAAVAAMRVLGVGRIALCSPYGKENAKLQRFLEAEGFEVLGERGLNQSLWDIHQLPTEYSYRLAKEAVRTAPGAECLYMAGGRLRTLEILDTLEQDLGIPVVASTPASVWQMLRLLDIHAPRTGYGQLLSTFPALPESAI